MEKIEKMEGIKPFDIFLTILEQQRQGVLHHDTKEDNIIFDGTFARFIDYDQAIYMKPLKSLSLKENLEFFINKKDESWYTGHGKSPLGEDKNEVWKNFNTCINKNRFDFSLTTLFEKITENSECYWELNENEIFAKGKNNFKNIARVLDNIEFKKEEKVLDFGSDIGSLSLYLADKSSAYYFDPNKFKMQATQIISNILQKKLTPYNLAYEKNFDTIFFLNDEIKLSPKFLDAIATKTRRIIIQESKNEEKKFKDFNLVKEFELENEKIIKVFEK
jgi:hypothetical protein